LTPSLRPCRPLHYGLVIMAAGVLFNLSSHGFGRFAYAVILPPMRDGLGLDYTQTGLLATANFTGYVVFSLLGGTIASRVGLRRLEVLGLALVGSSMLFTGLAGSFMAAAAGRTLTGLGSAIANVATLGLATAWFAPSRRGLAVGVIVGGSGLGISLSGVLVPMVVSSYGNEGWRYAWFCLSAIVLMVAGLAFLIARDRPSLMGLLPLGAEAKNKKDGNDENRETHERNERMKSRPEWRVAYTSPVLWRCGLAYFAFGLAYVVAGTFFVAYLQAEVGMTEVEAGSLWSTAGFISIFSPALFGAVSDSIGRSRGLAASFAIMGTSLTIFASTRSAPGAILATALFGLSVWPIPALIAALTGDLAGPRLAPAGLGFVTVLFGIGQAIGPGLGGYVADQTGSFAPALAASALIAFAAAAFSLTLPSRTSSVSLVAE